MIDFGELIPVVAILATACVTIALLHFSHERAKLKQGIAGTADEARENDRLVDENEALKQTVDRLEERLRVLERIATDPAERTSREIESLR